MKATLALCLAFVGCQPHDDYIGTPNGFRIYHLDEGIDQDEAVAALDAGVEAWLVKWPSYRDSCLLIEFHILDCATFVYGGSVVAGSIDLASGVCNLAWIGPPALPAIDHELNHLPYGHYH